ncbi:PAS domain S-box-containing protein [Catalinimonas alkaloidigena]|uniref:PAS domain S-box-containing protein n=1 Tax=Catalinimonas alkaloidigena TaxID=1075417 RepID=A0A1G8Y2E7_9BACT|nr:PAS domain S-box protein [Catalinimonas alkaloidigena]SDJ96624.1 PAS domain S-box-containing protein [Catalinimonas alkaloidigena]
MFKKVSIGTKVTLLVVVLIVAAVLAVSFFAFRFTRQTTLQAAQRNLEVIADVKAQRLNAMLTGTSSNLEFIQEIPLIQHYFAQALQPADTLEEALPDLTSKFDSIIRPLRKRYGFDAVYLISPEGHYVYDSEGTNEQGSAFLDPDGQTLEQASKETYFSNIFQLGDQFCVIVASPLHNTDDETIGIIACRIDMTPIYTQLQDTLGLGNTGEVMLGKVFQNQIVVQNPLRHDPQAALRRSFANDAQASSAMQRAMLGEKGSVVEKDYRNRSVLAAWHYLPSTQWGLVVKMDTSEILAPMHGLQMAFLIAVAIAVLMATIVTSMLSRSITAPLHQLKQTLQLLGRGVLPNEVRKDSNDEIGEMAEQVSEMVKGLRRTADFAHQIGQGDFDADFEPMSGEDTLGLALIGMSTSLQEAEKRDDERNWIIRGEAEVGEILRRHTSIDALSDEIIAFVTKKIGAIQGAFYVLEQDPNDERTYIRMKASYAYNKKKYLQAQFKMGEGLVGQSCIECDTVLRTEIPNDYVTVTSGLIGEKRPECLLIVPLVTNEEVNGALEFAGLERFTPRQVKFVQEVSQIIARTLFNIQVNERTRQLLLDAQKMSEELQQQQEILQQNAEEMEATQEELKRTNTKLEHQIEEVNRTQKRMQTLLENASEVITIYEEDGTIRYVSPSIERILGYRAEEVIGLKDDQFVHEENQQVLSKMYTDLLEKPHESVTVQIQYKRKNGEFVWLEATGNNLLDDPAIQGLVINSRDITERRLAEREARMRGQMQALSENSPDLITRVNEEGTFFYINPIIETYTGHKPDYFLQKSLDGVEIEGTLKESWRRIISQVIEAQQNVADEIDFQSSMGERVMQVNAIPEYNEEQKMESILLVSHDITDRKLIELEIQNKNKKITESINYAKRIQNAILPDNDTIHEVFTESFILYKPRDVVSGDFPWFLQQGDDIYLAAVDCTGHGVPGALISLIGYFLLNDIATSGTFSPAEILDRLDEGVTRTLKQTGAEGDTRDGMDVALCRVNAKQGTIEYAGAHRPLYHLREGELTELKGDKFPIGGGQYKNRTNFTNHVIEYKAGDTVVFFSDGFPDQFGGPNQKKFSPRRIREILQTYNELSMQELHEIYDQEFEAWRGEDKQTDDVLMIGLRF